MPVFVAGDNSFAANARPITLPALCVWHMASKLDLGALIPALVPHVHRQLQAAKGLLLAGCYLGAAPLAAWKKSRVGVRHKSADQVLQRSAEETGRGWSPDGPMLALSRTATIPPAVPRGRAAPFSTPAAIAPSARAQVNWAWGPSTRAGIRAAQRNPYQASAGMTSRSKSSIPDRS